MVFDSDISARVRSNGVKNVMRFDDKLLAMFYAGGVGYKLLLFAAITGAY